MSGIALLLTSGLTALLFILCQAALPIFLAQAGLSRRCTEGLSAELAAANGLEYAAARLQERPYAAADRCDDWTVRGDESPRVPSHRLENPSYARVDGYGNVYTGRTRGGVSPFDARFSLAIRSAASGICINSGELGNPTDDHDQDGVLDGSDPDYTADRDTDGIIGNGDTPNGVPDWRDPDFHGNRHLVNLLSNLGAVLDLSSATDAPYHPAVPAMGTIRASDLGRLVVAHRPREGYGAVEELRAFLPADDFGKTAPFLSAGGRRRTVAWMQPTPILGPDSAIVVALACTDRFACDHRDSRYEHHAPIDFQGASPEVLKSSLRSIAASGSPDARPSVRLAEAEADDIAEALAGVRRDRPIRTWKEFLAAVHDVSVLLVQDDPFTPQWDESTPEFLLLKEDLILAQAGPGGYFRDRYAGALNGLEVIREDPAAPVGMDAASGRVLTKSHLLGPVHSGNIDATGEIKSSDFTFNFDSRATAEYLLHDPLPGIYRVESHGMRGSALARRAGELSIVQDELFLDGQQDFEQAWTTPVSPWRYTGGAVRAEGPCRLKEAVETFPKFPLGSYDASLLPGGTAEDLHYPPVNGTLRLKTLQRPYDHLVGPCTSALPFNEDRMPGSGNLYDPVDWRDNLFDPIRSATPDGRRALYAVSPGSALQSLAPCGPREDGPVISWRPGDGYPLPFPAHPEYGIDEGTLACWFPWKNDDRIELEISVLGVLDDVAHTPWGRVVWIAMGEDGRVRVGPPTVSFSTFLEAGPASHRAGWHHLAVSFRERELHVHLDAHPVGVATLEIPATTVPDEFPPADYAATVTQCRLRPGGALDDIQTFTPPLSIAHLVRMAEQDRYQARTGRWISPRFAFDAARLPDGASLRGLAWNGFIPAATRGNLLFKVRGYDAGGALIGERVSPAWAWDSAEAAFLGCRMDGCLQMEIEAVLDGSDPEPVPIGDPAVLRKTLRDSPVLDDLRLLYATGRPRWNPSPAR